MRILMAALAMCAALSACSNNEAGNAENVDETLATADAANEATPVATNQAQAPLCDVLGERATTDECDDARSLAKEVRSGAAALNVPDPMTWGKPTQVTLVVDRRALAKIAAAENAHKSVPAAGGSPPTIGEGENSTEAMNVAEGTAAESADNATSPPPPPPPPPPTAAAEDTNEADAAATPTEIAENLAGKDVPFHSQVGRYMKATLVGEGFEITLLEPKDPVQTIPSDGQGTWIWKVVPTEAGRHTLTARTEAIAYVGGRTVPLGNGQTFKDVTVSISRMDRVRHGLEAIPGWLKLITAVLVAAGATLAAALALRRQWRKRDE